ncbi:MAG: hypothetical protein C0505_01340 [Leptothrix sp. (in: Bacteria)]|nr:hypothetical protein [Leptothrix sp. (in: b-proteobacteria)]
MLGDVFGSVAAIIAGIVFATTDWAPIDPLLSLLAATLIPASALRWLREVLHVPMEGVPLNVRFDAVGRNLVALPGVLRTHDLHVWTLSPGSVALSGHFEWRDRPAGRNFSPPARRIVDAHHAIRHITRRPKALTAQPRLRGRHPRQS